jgi:flagellar biosynthetic protein FlhB
VAEESDLEKTEDPSPRRLEQAREEGQVPQSRELSTFLVTVTGAATLLLLGGWMGGRVSGLFRDGFAFDRRAAFDENAMLDMLERMLSGALLTLMPLFFALLLAAVAAPMVLGGLVFAPNVLGVKSTRALPVFDVAEITTASGAAHDQGPDEPLRMAEETVAFAALLIASLGGPFQTRMLKARIRSQQREIARRRMMAEVPKADVVVTNPTHFAVALPTTRSMGAPRVVAKGRGGRRPEDPRDRHGTRRAAARGAAAGARALRPHRTRRQSIPSGAVPRRGRGDGLCLPARRL